MPRRIIANDPLLIRVGDRVRTLRLEHDLSLERLAARAQLFKGNLSSVEHGLVNVTVKTLYRISLGLEEELWALFIFPEENIRHARALRAASYPIEIDPFK
jgi:transcriptional regulator with XRE-family HTH domain